MFQFVMMKNMSSLECAILRENVPTSKLERYCVCWCEEKCGLIAVLHAAPV